MNILFMYIKFLLLMEVVKCLLMSSLLQGLITSVKSFQYRRRTEYELYVYIDDGSYISMALVDHSVSTSVSIINYREKISLQPCCKLMCLQPLSFQTRVHFLGSYISMALVDHSVSTSVSIINYREKISLQPCCKTMCLQPLTVFKVGSTFFITEESGPDFENYEELQAC
jgi:hypothetical protein